MNFKKSLLVFSFILLVTFVNTNDSYLTQPSFMQQSKPENSHQTPYYNKPINQNQNTQKNSQNYIPPFSQQEIMKERNRQIEQITQFLVVTFIIVSVIVNFIFVGIGIYAAYKCYLKRKVSNRIKDDMYLRQMQFASSMGMTVLQVRNDKRFGVTNHL